MGLAVDVRILGSPGNDSGHRGVLRFTAGGSTPFPSSNGNDEVDMEGGDS